MSKRKRRKASTITTALTPASSTWITTKPASSAGITSSVPVGPAALTSSGLGGRLALFALAVMALMAAWMSYASSAGAWPFNSEREPRKKEQSAKAWQAPAWKPESTDDKLIDRFVRLRKAKDAEALKLLSPLPPVEKPIAESEFEPCAADHFLRSDKLKIVEIWKGEPGKDGKPVPARGRYTLVTKGSASTPPLLEKNANGGASPSQMHINNPKLVVEVKGGVIHGVRTDNRIP